MMGLNHPSKQSINILAKQNIPVSVGGTTSEVALFTCTIPAGMMGENGMLRVYAKFSYTNSANNKSLFVRFGGAQMWTQVLTTTSFLNAMVHIINRNSVSSQIGGGSYTGGFGGAGAATETATIDTSVDTTLTISGASTLETGFTPAQANMSGDGTTVTVVYTNHGLITGDYIYAASSSTSGYNNANSLMVTRIDANTFTYLGTGTGTPTTSPTIRRFSVITLEAAYVEVMK